MKRVLACVALAVLASSPQIAVACGYGHGDYNGGYDRGPYDDHSGYGHGDDHGGFDRGYDDHGGYDDRGEYDSGGYEHRPPPNLLVLNGRINTGDFDGGVGCVCDCGGMYGGGVYVIGGAGTGAGAGAGSGSSSSASASASAHANASAGVSINTSFFNSTTIIGGGFHGGMGHGGVGSHGGMGGHMGGYGTGSGHW